MARELRRPMTASTKDSRNARQTESEAHPGPAASPEAALKVLRERGREMSEEEREAYIRQAVKMIDPADLADRLITRVPSLAGQAGSAPHRRAKDGHTDPELEDADNTETSQSASHRSASRRAAELLGDLVFPNEEGLPDEEINDDDDDEADKPHHLTSATRTG